MTYSELIEDVGIGERQVGDRVRTDEQSLVHRPVNDPALLLLVGTKRLQLRVADGRLDHVVVNTVEVDRSADRVCLHAKRH